MQLEKSPKRIVKHKTLKFSKEYGDLSGLKQSIKNQVSTGRQSVANQGTNEKKQKGGQTGGVDKNKVCRNCHKRIIDAADQYFVTEDDPEALLLTNISKNKMMTQIKKLFTSEIAHYKQEMQSMQTEMDNMKNIIRKQAKIIMD